MNTISCICLTLGLVASMARSVPVTEAPKGHVDISETATEEIKSASIDSNSTQPTILNEEISIGYKVTKKRVAHFARVFVKGIVTSEYAEVSKGSPLREYVNLDVFKQVLIDLADRLYPNNDEVENSSSLSANSVSSLAEEEGKPLESVISDRLEPTEVKNEDSSLPVSASDASIIGKEDKQPIEDVNFERLEPTDAKNGNSSLPLPVSNASGQVKEEVQPLGSTIIEHLEPTGIKNEHISLSLEESTVSSVVKEGTKSNYGAIADRVEPTEAKNKNSSLSLTLIDEASKVKANMPNPMASIIYYLEPKPCLKEFVNDFFSERKLDEKKIQSEKCNAEAIFSSVWYQTYCRSFLMTFEEDKSVINRLCGRPTIVEKTD